MFRYIIAKTKVKIQEQKKKKHEPKIQHAFLSGDKTDSTGE